MRPGIFGLATTLLNLAPLQSLEPLQFEQLLDELTLLVIRVDPNERRIGLSLKELAHAMEAPREGDDRGGRRGKRGKHRDDFDYDEE